MKLIAEGTRDWIEYVLTLAPGLSSACFYSQIHYAPVQLAGGKAARAKHLLESIAYISNTHLEYQCHRVNHCHCYELVTVFFPKRHPLKQLMTFKQLQKKEKKERKKLKCDH